MRLFYCLVLSIKNKTNRFNEIVLVHPIKISDQSNNLTIHFTASCNRISVTKLFKQVLHNKKKNECNGIRINLITRCTRRECNNLLTIK